MDGTEAFWLRSATNELVQITPEGLDALNASRLFALDYPNDPDWYSLIFPAPMKIFGVYVTQEVDIETSADTTTTVDGTWESVGTYPSSCTRGVEFNSSNTASSVPLLSRYRPLTETYITVTTGVDVIGSYRKQYDLDGEGIHRLSGAGLRGVRSLRFRANISDGFGNTYFPINLHLYGEPENLPAERLQIVLPDEAPLTSGSTGFGQQQAQVPSAPKQFRVLNRSLTRRATGVELTIDELRKSSTTWPSIIAAQAEYSADGTSGWATSLSLGDIEPGESVPFYVRAVPQGPNGFTNNYASYATSSHLGWFQNLMIPSVTEWVDA